MSRVNAYFSHFEDALWLLGSTLLGLFSPPFRWRDYIKQFYLLANKSLLIISFCVSFAAVVTIIEASFHIKLILQNDSMVPGFASVLILRELGAVVTALLLTSRVGAGIAAEVATMKVTEQIDALKILSIDPIRYLVVPRLVACTLGGLVLSLVASIVCVFCAMLVCIMKLGFTAGSFLQAMTVFVKFQDLVFSGIKGAVFGAVIPLVSCHFGLRSRHGADGVGHATTQSVVVSSVLIIILDFVLGWVFTQYY